MIRIDAKGRDVTNLPGMWSEDDTEHPEPDLDAMYFDVNIANEFMSQKHLRTKADLLWEMFTWQPSPQGFDYWQFISNSLKYGYHDGDLRSKVDSIIRSFIVAYHRQNP